MELDLDDFPAWTVESIKGMKNAGKTRAFLVKWAGQSALHDSWEWEADVPAHKVALWIQDACPETGYAAPPPDPAACFFKLVNSCAA